MKNWLSKKLYDYRNIFFYNDLGSFFRKRIRYYSLKNFQSNEKSFLKSKLLLIAGEKSVSQPESGKIVCDRERFS